MPPPGHLLLPPHPKASFGCFPVRGCEAVGRGGVVALPRFQLNARTLDRGRRAGAVNMTCTTFISKDQFIHLPASVSSDWNEAQRSLPFEALAAHLSPVTIRYIHASLCTPAVDSPARLQWKASHSSCILLTQSCFDARPRPGDTSAIRAPELARHRESARRPQSKAASVARRRRRMSRCRRARPSPLSPEFPATIRRDEAARALSASRSGGRPLGRHVEDRRSVRR
jgi:hypothetical protein